MVDPLLVQLGVLSAAQLLQLGWSRWEIERAVQLGTLLRLRSGWFAQPGASASVVSAVRQGGCLACASALRARYSRDITVPSATSSTSAISA